MLSVSGREHTFVGGLPSLNVALFWTATKRFVTSKWGNHTRKRQIFKIGIGQLYGKVAREIADNQKVYKGGVYDVLHKH